MINIDSKHSLDDEGIMLVEDLIRITNTPPTFTLILSWARCVYLRHHIFPCLPLGMCGYTLGQIFLLKWFSACKHQIGLLKLPAWKINVSSNYQDVSSRL